MPPSALTRPTLVPARRLWLAAGRKTDTNASLLAAFARLGWPAARAGSTRLAAVASRDAVLGRLDVLPTLDGVEPGIWRLRHLERRGIRVLNPTGALLASHDKLATALAIARAGLPHPRTSHVGGLARERGAIELPVVVKPRFGSWGRDVFLCETRRQLERCLRELGERSWFVRQGALVQEFVPPAGFDLRLVVAAGRVVGAIERVAAPGEWRTNVALGGRRRPVDELDPGAEALAVAAAGAVGGDLVGVDLLPVRGGYVVLEVNGAVDFSPAYALAGRDVYGEVAGALCDALASAEPVEPLARTELLPRLGRGWLEPAAEAG